MKSFIGALLGTLLTVFCVSALANDVTCGRAPKDTDSVAILLAAASDDEKWSCRGEDECCTEDGLHCLVDYCCHDNYSACCIR